MQYLSHMCVCIDTCICFPLTLRFLKSIVEHTTKESRQSTRKPCYIEMEDAGNLVVQT